MKRTFVGIKIELQQEFQDVIGKLKQSLAEERMRWVIPDNLHLTLHFFGNTEADDEEKLMELFHDFAKTVSPVSFSLKGVSFFKKRLQPKVLFVDLDLEDSDELLGMAQKLRAQLVEQGFAKADQAFNPHVTIARIKQLKSKEKFIGLLGQFSDQPRQMIKAGEIIFYESVLKPEGPIYRPIKTYSLEG